MCNNWVAVINDERYINLLSRKKGIGDRVDNGIVPKKKK